MSVSSLRFWHDGCPLTAGERGHHGGGTRVVDEGLPGGGVELLQRALVDGRVDGAAVVLLRVEVVVLERRAHARDALNPVVSAAPSSAVRAGLRERLEARGSTGRAGGRSSVRASCRVRQVCLDTRHLAVAERAPLAEGRAQGGTRGQQRRLAATDVRGDPHADRTVCGLHGRDPEPCVRVVVEAVVRLTSPVTRSTFSSSHIWPSTIARCSTAGSWSHGADCCCAAAPTGATRRRSPQ